MIEKSFDKIYKFDVSKGVLTRTANRMIAEYVAANGGWSVPDEIKAIAEQIRHAEDSEPYEEESENEYFNSGDRIYDKVKYTNENRAHAFWDEDEYGDAIYRVTWYFFSSERYTKTIGGKVLQAGTYEAIYRKIIAAKGKYRYFCVHRPPTAGAIPKGFVSYDVYIQGNKYCGEATYNEQPPEEMLYNSGLVLDTDWERIRKAYLEEEQ